MVVECATDSAVSRFADGLSWSARCSLRRLYTNGMLTSSMAFDYEHLWKPVIKKRLRRGSRR